jgi:hypothetical protein
MDYYQKKKKKTLKDQDPIIDGLPELIVKVENLMSYDLGPYSGLSCTLCRQEN